MRDRTSSTIWSIGHSNRSWGSFEGLLRHHVLAAVADVRAFPTSRRWPHFERDTMAERLASLDIVYRWMPALGGRRPRARPDSPHHGWTVAGFRNYADYMETEAFAHGLEALEALARERQTAFMCAEVVHWRCHRRLLSDALKCRGWRVLHIEGGGTPAEHRYTQFLRIADGRLVYDGVGTEAGAQTVLPLPRRPTPPSP